jgi:hypothetical protein
MAESRYGGSERPASRRSDSIFGEHDDRLDNRGGSSEGGLFQRAGEEVRSWFSEGDDRSRTRGQSPGSRSDYGAYRGGHSDPDQRETWGGGNEWRGARSGSSPFDDHYMSWRERQIRQLDQDYQDYCRDRQQQFESDFHGWREKRQGQSGAPTGQASGSGPEGGGAAATAGGGGELSATESSTGSSATTGTGARAGRKPQETK